MGKSNSGSFLSNLLTCIIYAVIGVLLIIFKSGSLGIVMTVAGVLFIVMGIIDIIKSKDLIKGIIEIAIGAAILILGWAFVEIVLLVFGILLIVKGVLDLFKSFGAGLKAMLSPIITIAVGILLIVCKFKAIDLLFIIVGVVFIINAVLALFGKKS